MESGVTRRGFLALSAGSLTGSRVIGSGAAAETTTISGTIRANSGAKIQGDEINFSGGGGFHSVNTDNSGQFTADVPKNQTYKMGFYKADSRSDFEAVKNGAPHIYSPGYYTVGDGPKDLGTIELPEAHLVDLRILKSSGEAFLGAQPGFRHNGWGENPSRVAINTEGYTVIKGATFTGAEFAESVTLEVEPPAGDKYESTTHKKPISVEEPMTVTAVLDGSGVDWNVETTAEFTESGSQTTPTTTTTTTTEPSPTTTTAASPTTSTTQTTTRIDHTSSAPAESARANTTTVNRGFLSNEGENTDMEYLTDPFSLTLVGFVLSVGGIAHQMLRGY